MAVAADPLIGNKGECRRYSPLDSFCGAYRKVVGVFPLSEFDLMVFS